MSTPTRVPAHHDIRWRGTCCDINVAITALGVPRPDPARPDGPAAGLVVACLGCSEPLTLTRDTPDGWLDEHDDEDDWDDED